MNNKIYSECKSCNGTGLYEGMCEKKGESVICLVCEGTGCAVISYVPYTHRKRKLGVNVVRQSRGNLIVTGVGGINGTEMTYEEFRTKVPGNLHDVMQTK